MMPRNVASSLALVALLMSSSSTSQATPAAKSVGARRTPNVHACTAVPAATLPSRRFSFPRDDGAHDGYAVEWWRTFGRVTDDAGKRFDFSVNVSRFAADTKKPTVRATSSRWAAHRLVTTSYEFLDEQTLDVARGTVVEREDALGAAISSHGLSIVARALTYASVRLARGHRRFALAFHDASDANAVTLEQTPLKDALALGPGGVMRTGSCASDEAYAYAYTRNATRGVLRFAGVDRRVSGSTWIEHEFAHTELAPSDAGWNRFEVQFDDGRDVDARFAHDADGNVVATSGAFVAADGEVTYLTSESAETLIPPDARKPDAQWHSNASDSTYPAMWYFIIKPGRLALATVEMTHDQEIRAAGRTPYYWGAIVVEKYGPPGGDPGHGFVELTGYAGRRAL